MHIRGKDEEAERQRKGLECEETHVLRVSCHSTEKNTKTPTQLLSWQLSNDHNDDGVFLLLFHWMKWERESDKGKEMKDDRKEEECTAIR